MAHHLSTVRQWALRLIQPDVAATAPAAPESVPEPHLRTVRGIHSAEICFSPCLGGRKPRRPALRRLRLRQPQFPRSPPGKAGGSAGGIAGGGLRGDRDRGRDRHPAPRRSAPDRENHALAPHFFSAPVPPRKGGAERLSRTPESPRDPEEAPKIRAGAPRHRAGAPHHRAGASDALCRL